MNNPFGNDFDPDDPLSQEEEEVKDQLKLLVDKVRLKSDEPVTNSDLLQYMRAINLNFATMHRIIMSFYMKLDVIDEYLGDLNTKLDTFIESNGLIDEVIKSIDGDEDESTLTNES